MPVMKRMLVIAALLLLPAALAWASQALTRPAGTPDVGNATITVSVVPGADPEIRRPEEPDPPVQPSPAPESVAPAAPTDEWSDVQRRPLHTPSDDWDDDDWDDDSDDDSDDDDWDDDDDD